MKYKKKNQKGVRNLLAKTGILYVCNKVKEETDTERSRIYQQRRINKLLNQTFEMYLI